MDERDFKLSLSLAWPDPRVEGAPALLAPQGACNEQPAQQARDAILCPPAEWFALGITVGLPSPAAEPPNAVPALRPVAIINSPASKSPATHSSAEVEQTEASQSERSSGEQQSVSTNGK